MRLSSVSISGFRGFTTEVSVSVDGDFVLLTGPNGVGKTSFMDAILWCVTGRIPRLEAVALKKGEDYVSNKYASVLPGVEIRLAGSDGITSVTRRGVGRDQRLVIAPPDGDPLSGEEAKLWLSQHFNPDASEGRGFQRAFVLQQDDIREFLNADPGERYRYLSYLAGVEDAEALDRQLKSELKKLKEASREIATSLEVEESRLNALERSRAESRQIVERVDVQELARESSVKEELLGLLQSPTPPTSLDELMQTARDRLRQIETRLDDLERRGSAVRAAEQVMLETRYDPSLVESLTRLTNESASRLRDLEEQAVGLDQQARDAAVQEDRRRQLAALALDQLDGESCPVCDQEFNRSHAVAHLREILGGDSRSRQLRQDADAARARADAESANLIDIRRRLEEEERAALSFQHASSRREAEEAELERIRSELRDLVGEAISPMQHARALRRALQSAESVVATVKRQSAGQRQLTEIERGLISQHAAVDHLSQRRRELADRVSRAEATCSWLGERLVDATGKVLRSTTPLVNELYARLDIHPTMRRFDFHTERHYQAGRILPWLFDDEANIGGNAGHLLSSAQLNVLAVCLFFSMNLLQQWSPLDVVVMDDPVQSMDEVHVLGLADTLRSARHRRQIVVSTHDSRVAEMLWRKLRPVGQHAKNLRVEFTDWSPTDGPSLKLEERVSQESSGSFEVLSPKNPII